MIGTPTIAETPELFVQWDFEKNDGINPYATSCGSGKIVWWICDEGHSWSAAIYSRKYNGCPYCSGLLPLVGENDLVTTHPQILDEWDFELNGSDDPQNYKAGSGKKVWWKCKIGHKYDQTILNHTNGSGCPYCKGGKSLSGFNDIKTMSPDYLNEWDTERNLPLKPEMLRLYSNKKVWWKCNNGHSYISSLDKRTIGGGCPYCAGKRVLIGFNDLKTIMPKIAKQWDYTSNGELLPDMVTVGSNRSVWWICKENHRWKTKVCNVSGGMGCPYCAGKKAWIGYNDLATRKPELIAEWDYEMNVGLSPQEFTCGSKKKVWWKCRNGHRWMADICNRMAGKGCPYCSGHLVVQGENDLLSVFPELVREWDHDKNGEITAGSVGAFSNAKVWWRCKEGHSWYAQISNRANGRDCPVCAGKIAIVGVTDLFTKYPELVNEWDFDKNANINPQDILPSSSYKVWWKCRKGHSWKTIIAARTRGNGCPYCAGLVKMRTHFIT